MVPSSNSVTVSKPACGWAPPTCRSPMSRWSSINAMNGSVRANSSIDITGAAVCPGPAKPGASAGTSSMRAIRRCVVIVPTPIFQFSGCGAHVAGRSGRVSLRELHQGTDDGHDDRTDAPESSRERIAEQRIEREHSRTAERDTQRGGREHEVVFVPTARGKEAVLQMHRDRRDEHDGRDERCAERREQPQREQHAAASFGEPCQRRMAATGMEAERLHELPRAVETVAAEPSKQLLCAVRSEGETNNESQDQKSEVHNTFSFCINRLFSDERSDAGEPRRRRLPRATEPPAGWPSLRR